MKAIIISIIVFLLIACGEDSKSPASTSSPTTNPVDVPAVVTPDGEEVSRFGHATFGESKFQ